MEKSEGKLDLTFPESLTVKDIDLVLAQCRNQQATSKEQIEGFAGAYKKAKDMIDDLEQLETLSAEDIISLILQFASMIEKRNLSGFRVGEVTIKNQRLLPASEVSRAMAGFSGDYSQFLKNPPTEDELKHPLAPTPDKLYEKFEEIHPFEDGNGRVGDLLWKIATARKTGNWPEELPPNLFSDEPKP